MPQSGPPAWVPPPRRSLSLLAVARGGGVQAVSSETPGRPRRGTARVLSRPLLCSGSCPLGGDSRGFSRRVPSCGRRRPARDLAPVLLPVFLTVVPEGRSTSARHSAALGHPSRAIDAGVPSVPSRPLKAQVASQEQPRRPARRTSSEARAVPKPPAAGGHSQIFEYLPRRRADPCAGQAGRQRGPEDVPLRMLGLLLPRRRTPARSVKPLSVSSVSRTAWPQRRSTTVSRSPHAPCPLLLSSFLVHPCPPCRQVHRHSGYTAHADVVRQALSLLPLFRSAPGTQRTPSRAPRRTSSTPSSPWGRTGWEAVRPQGRSTTECSVSSSPSLPSAAPRVLDHPSLSAPAVATGRLR